MASRNYSKEVEEKLTDDTKLQIAIWLVGVNTTRTVENWPVTFTKMFDRMFGRQHVTWKCFWRSCIASYSALFVSGIVGAFLTKYNLFKHLVIAPEFLVTALLGNVFTDYISLLQTRTFLALMNRSSKSHIYVILLVLDALITYSIACIGLALSSSAIMIYILWHYNTLADRSIILPYLRTVWRVIDVAVLSGALFKSLQMNTMFIAPAFFTSIWLWLYAGSGFLLRTARHFDLGFMWFSGKFDIEQKPLQSIGLVAGTVCALAYWGVVLVIQVVNR
jgi:hypothetical protein